MSQSKPCTPRSKGVTLVELMVTIAILAIITTVAAPSMVGLVARWQLSNAVNAFTSSIQLARSEAVKRGRNTNMCLRNTSGTSCASSAGTRGWASGWIVYVDNNGNGALNPAVDTIVFVQDNLTALDEIGTSGFAHIQFTPFGTLRGGAGMQGLTFNWDSNGDYKRGLCISFTGRTRLVTESPDCNGGQG